MPVTRQSGSSSKLARSNNSRNSNGGRIRIGSNDGKKMASHLLDEETGESIWGVKSIQSKKIDSTGRVSYLIDWENYSGDPTWEPAENCKGCDLAIREFEDKVARNTRSSRLRPSTSSDRSDTPQSSSGTRYKNTKSFKKEPLRSNARRFS